MDVRALACNPSTETTHHFGATRDMAIYTSFIVSSYRAFDEARKKAKRTGKDVLALLGDANVDLDWNDSFAEAFLKYLVGRTVEDEQDREAFMVEPIEAPGYVLFPLPEQLVEALAGWSEKKRAATVRAPRGRTSTCVFTYPDGGRRLASRVDFRRVPCRDDGATR